MKKARIKRQSSPLRRSGVRKRAPSGRFRGSIDDLVLADGEMERAERQFLHRLAENLGLDRMRRDVVLRAMLIKNSA